MVQEQIVHHLGLNNDFSRDPFSGSRIIGSEWGGWKVKEAKPTEARRPGGL